MSVGSRAGVRMARLACLLAVVLLAGACGKKGPPQPPLRPVPARITDLAARLANDAVTLTFTAPAGNVDGSTPSAVERIEIYRDVARPPAPETEAGGRAGGAPTAQRPPPLVSPANLVGTIPVERPPLHDEPPPPGAVVPGASVTWTDPATLPAVADPGAAPTWRYVVVPVAGGSRRPGASNLVQVPFGAVAPPPAAIAVSYDAERWLVRWTAAEGTSYVVYDVPPGGGERMRLTEAPLAAAPFATPVAFGAERCFVVQPVVVREAVTIEGPASAPACDTAVDTFAPPAPGSLVAVQQGAAVVLTWSAVTATDLGGYRVLRGEGQGATLSPLVATPMAGTSYRDESVRAGVTYIYAVVAIDRATPPNASEESNRQTVVVREATDGS